MCKKIALGIVFILGIIINNYSQNEKNLIYLQEGFEDATSFPPDGWTIIDLDGDGYQWQCSPVGGWGVNSGSGCATSASYNSNTNTALTPENYLITPKIDIDQPNMELQYYVSVQEAAFPAEHYKVAVSTTGTNPSDFSDIIFEETMIAKATGQNYERNINLNNYLGQSIYIAFVHYNCTNQFFLNLDDVSVYLPFEINGAITQIITPQNSCDYNDSVSVSIYIKNDGINAFSNFEVSYNINNQTATETISDTIAAMDSMYYTFNTLVSLNQNINNQIYACINVENDAYSNDDTLSKMLYVGPAEMPYEVHFEPNEAYDFWLIEDINNDNRRWNWASSGGNDNPACMRYDFSYSNAANDALFTKCMFLEANKKYRLSFYYKGGSSYFYENLHVYLNQFQHYTDTLLSLAKLDSFNNVSYKKFDTTFMVDSSAVYYLGFFAKSEVNNLFIYIDDIMVEEVFSYDAGIITDNVDYYILPQKQIRPIDFSCKITNYGDSLLNNVKIHYDEINTNWQQIDSIGILSSGDFLQTTSSSYFTPSQQGNYFAVASFSSAENDQNPQNNQDTIQFIVSDTIMARENGVVTNGLGIGNPGYLGQMFEITQKDTLTSISFYLKFPTENDTVYAAVFTFDTVPQQMLRKTPTMIIPTQNSQWYTLPIEGNYLALDSGKYFIAVKEHAENITLGSTPKYYKPNTAFIRIGNGQWKTNESVGFPYAYLLRANMGAITQLPDYDVSLVDFSSPQNNCNLNNNALAQITVKNTGAYAISNIPVLFSYNNTTIIDTIFDTLNTWESVDFTFTQPINLDQIQSYSFTCYTQLANDANNSNDTIKWTIENGPEIIPYTFGFESNENISDWLIEDNNNDMFTWDLAYESAQIAHSGTNAAIYQYNIGGTDAADDWLFSKCLFIEAGKTYGLSYFYKTGTYQGTSYPEKLKLHLVNTPISDSANSENLIHDYGTFTSSSYSFAEHTISVDVSGIYYVGFHVYSDANKYFITIDDVNISDVTSMDNNIENNQLKLYPNPVSEVLSIKTKNIKAIRYEVYTITGDKIKQATICNNYTNIDLKSLPAGLYILRVYSQNNIINKQFIITK